MTVVATNKKAYHEFFIEETFEAGIQLVGSEVISIRNGGVTLKDSFAIVKNGELFLINAHISPYKMGSFYNPDPRRERRLLMHKREIDRIAGKVQQKGASRVVTKMDFKQSLVKVEVALAKGKELHDKRNALKEKQLNREVSRALADYR